MDRAQVRQEQSAEARETGDRLDALLESVDVRDVHAAPDVRQTYGTVERGGTEVIVRVGDRAVRAARAVSCLVEPRIGDRVLVALAEESFVLAVLANAEGQAPGVILSVEGDLTLRASSGKLALAARDAVSLTGGTKVEINTPELDVRAMKTSFFSASLSYIGRTLDSNVDRMTVAAQTVDRTIDRVRERLKQSFRTIEGLEKVRAKELDVDVEGNLNVHADSTLVAAEKLVKVDGEQIHLG